MSRFSARADHETARAAERESTLGCKVNGCPNRGSVWLGQMGAFGQGLCSAHAWADPALWPAITDAEQDKAIARQSRPPMPPAPPRYSLSKAERADILDGLRQLSTGQGGRAWAYAMRDRHAAGERLTPAQVDAYRAAIGQGESHAA